MLVICISTTLMAIGFAVRIPEKSNPYSVGLYIAMTFFTLLSPCGFLAQDYMIIPRLASHLGAEDCLFLSSRKIVRIFVWSDGITFFLQASGGGLTASDKPGNQNLGHWVSLLILSRAATLTCSDCPRRSDPPGGQLRLLHDHDYCLWPQGVSLDRLTRRISLTLAASRATPIAG